MKEIQYKAFSRHAHRKNWRIRNPNVCQFELTFGCGLRCAHCYTDCYNHPKYLERELDTQGTKLILDKVYNVGVIWLCFTGGDPLSRPDFSEIYAYAKDKGFVITLFTNAFSMDKRTADFLRKRPPFSIEMTLNGVTESTYESISQIKGSFKKAMAGIDMILKAGLPLKIKTQVTTMNFDEVPRIRQFVRGLGLKFRPSVLLHSRLNQDTRPAGLRISPSEVLNLDRNRISKKENCSTQTENKGPFPCAVAGGDGLYIDPYGNLVPCDCIRNPSVNLLNTDLTAARNEILAWLRSRISATANKCVSCRLRRACLNCPGKALLEKGCLQEKVDWFCELAHRNR